MADVCVKDTTGFHPVLIIYNADSFPASTGKPFPTRFLFPIRSVSGTTELYGYLLASCLGARWAFECVWCLLVSSEER